MSLKLFDSEHVSWKFFSAVPEKITLRLSFEELVVIQQRLFNVCL